MGIERRAKMVVLDGATVNPGDNPWDDLARLGPLAIHDRTRDGEVVERAAGAEIVLTNKTPLREAELAALPALRFVAVLATGHDVVDLEAARRRGIVVSNVPEYGTDSVAQHAFALLLELTNRVALHAEAVRSGDWIRSPDFSFAKLPPVELDGKTLGIVGFGRIGRRVGGIARAFGMEVVAAGQRRGDDGPLRLPVPELFATADVVSLHCPATPENLRFVNRELISRMKRTAYIVNTARGALVDETALAEALRGGWIAGAAVDVVSAEPMRPDNPLLGAPNLVVTPHLAWASLEARRRLMAATVRNVEAYLAGRPTNVVT